MSKWLFLFGLALMALNTGIALASLVNIGDDKPMDPLNGRICGIGDMNKDGNTDVIVQQKGETSGTSKLLVYLQTENADFKNLTQTIELPWDGEISCNVGDFNGDSCPDLLIVQPIAEDLDLIDKIKAVFVPSKKQKYQALIYLNERNGKFVEMACDKDNVASASSSEDGGCIPTALFLDHPILADVNGDGISDIVGFQIHQDAEHSGSKADETNVALFCRAGQYQEAVHSFKFKPCEGHFPVLNNPSTEFAPVFTDLDSDLGSEFAFVQMEENSSSRKGKRRLVIWKLTELSDSDNFKWAQNDALSIDLPGDDKRLANPLVADVDSDGGQELLFPICENDNCNSVTGFWCYKYNQTERRPQWYTVAVDMGKATIHPEVDGDVRVLFRIGDFSQNGFPDLIGTMSKDGGMPVPMILENVIDFNGNFTRKFEHSQKPQRIIQTDVQDIHLSAFFDLKEDGNLDILYEYYADKDPKRPMVNFIKCDDKGDTTFLKVQIFTGPECQSGQCCNVDTETSKRVRIGSGIAWTGACVLIKMADSSQGLIEQGMRTSLQCQIPQTSHRIMHNPFVLFGLSRSPNFVEEVHFGAPRLPSMGRNQHDMIRQIVPNSRVIIIPPALSDKGGNWQTRFYVTPSRLIILSILVMVSMCIILLILIGVLHLRERHEDKKERQAQTHRFHFDAM